MTPKRGNTAFIDGANLHKGAASLGLNLDYGRFRIWLKEKYGVDAALLFIGYVSSNKALYGRLRQAGYQPVFKETTRDGTGNIKGNCDADLVLWCVRGTYGSQYEKAVIVSGDGDYAGLVRFLRGRDALECVVSPGARCSILLMRTGAPITYLRDIRVRVESLPK